MATGKYSKVREWMKQEQGKHFCQCGCGEAIRIQPHHHKKAGIRRFIQGHRVRLGSKQIKELYESFWDKVSRGGDNDCWNWVGYVRPDGYGTLTSCHLGKGLYLSNRVSYTLHFGDIPDGYDVLHNCDNRKCVNPKHLYLGDAKDNNRDMIARNRHGRRAVINGKTAVEIVGRVRSGESLAAVSRTLGLKKGIVSNVMNGHSWSFFTGIGRK